MQLQIRKGYNYSVQLKNSYERLFMITVNIRETDEFIKLGQALKKAGLVETGVDAKFFIQDGQVTLNGEVEVQRGKKLYNGDIVSFNGETIQIVK